MVCPYVERLVHILRRAALRFLLRLGLFEPRGPGRSHVLVATAALPGLRRFAPGAVPKAALLNRPRVPPGTRSGWTSCVGRAEVRVRPVPLVDAGWIISAGNRPRPNGAPINVRPALWAFSVWVPLTAVADCAARAPHTCQSFMGGSLCVFESRLAGATTRASGTMIGTCRASGMLQATSR